MKTAIVIFFKTIFSTILIFFSPISFTEDKKLNKILNKFYISKSYHCSYSESYSTGYQDIPSGFTNEPEMFLKDYVLPIDDLFISRNVILFNSNDKIAIILERPLTKWLGRSELIYKKVSKDEYNLCGMTRGMTEVTWEEEKCNGWWKLKFDKKTLNVNYAKTYFSNIYQCKATNLSSTEKKYFLNRFLANKLDNLKKLN